MAGFPSYPKSRRYYGACYRSRCFRETCGSRGITHRFTKPYLPQTNGKGERLIHTALREWVYKEEYTSSEQRREQPPQVRPGSLDSLSTVASNPSGGKEEYWTGSHWKRQALQRLAKPTGGSYGRWNHDRSTGFLSRFGDRF